MRAYWYTVNHHTLLNLVFKNKNANFFNEKLYFLKARPYRMERNESNSWTATFIFWSRASNLEQEVQYLEPGPLQVKQQPEYLYQSYHQPPGQPQKTTLYGTSGLLWADHILRNSTLVLRASCFWNWSSVRLQ